MSSSPSIDDSSIGPTPSVKHQGVRASLKVIFQVH
jgi:hypothetical protein